MDKIKFETPKLQGISDGALNQYKFMINFDFYLFLEEEAKNQNINVRDVYKMIASHIFDMREVVK